MQTQKMSLANIKGMLSRVEMKNIMAGSGTGYCGDKCFNNDDCKESSMCKTCGSDKKCF